MRAWRPVPALTILALLAATAAGAVFAWRAERDQAHEEDAAAAQRAALAARRVMDASAASMRGVDGLLDPGGRLRPAGFREFARDVLAALPFPAMAWAPAVTGEQRTIYELQVAAIRVLAPNGRRLVAAPRRPRYLPVTLIEPPDRSRGVLGFDLLGDPVRAEAVRRSQKRREPQITRPTLLAGPGRIGVTQFAPVFSSAPGPGGRPRLAGVVGAELSGGLLARAVARQVDGDFTISDGRVLASAGAVGGGETTSFPVGGRTWTVATDPVGGASILPALSVVLLGLVLTGLVAAFMVEQSRRERRLEEERAAAEQGAERQRVLARTADAVEQHINVEDRLEALAETLVPSFADLCIAYEVARDGRLHRAAVAARSPELADAVRSSEGLGRAVTDAVDSGQAQLLAAERLDPMVLSPADAEARRRMEPSSAIVAPLPGRQQVVGALTLARLGATRRPDFNRGELELATEIAEQAAYAVENAQLYERERSIATTLQRALLPGALPRIPGVDLAASYQSGEAGNRVGGDLYDAFESGAEMALLVADVSGKGAEAAALTALVRHTFKASLRDDPAGATAAVDRAVRAEGPDSFCTLAAVRLSAPADDGVGGLACVAGHPPPRILKTGGGVEALPGTGPLVGVVEDARFDSVPLRLGPGDAVVLFTDGLVEASGPGGRFGEERLDEVLASSGGRGAQEVIDRVLAAWSEHARGAPQDDVVVLVLRVGGGNGIG